MSTKETLLKGKAILERATRAPWKWWTSNSIRRLTGPDERDGGVLHAAMVEPGVADVEVSAADMAAIEWLRNNGQEMVFALLIVMKNKDEILMALKASLLAGEIGPLTHDRIKAELVRALEWE